MDAHEPSRGPRTRTLLIIAAIIVVLMAAGFAAIQKYDIGTNVKADRLTSVPSCARTFGRGGSSGAAAGDGTLGQTTATTSSTLSTVPKSPTTTTTGTTTQPSASDKIVSEPVANKTATTSSTMSTAPQSGTTATTTTPTTTTTTTTTTTPGTNTAAAAGSQSATAAATSATPTLYAPGAGPAGAQAADAITSSDDITPPDALACITMEIRWDGNSGVVTGVEIATADGYTNAIPTGMSLRGNECAADSIRAPRTGDIGGGPCITQMMVIKDAGQIDTGLLGFSVFRRHGFGSYDLQPLGIAGKAPIALTGFRAVSSGDDGTVTLHNVNGTIRLNFSNDSGDRFNLSPTPGGNGHVVVVRFFVVPAGATNSAVDALVPTNGLGQQAGAAGTTATTPTTATTTPTTSSQIPKLTDTTTTQQQTSTSGRGDAKDLAKQQQQQR